MSTSQRSLQQPSEHSHPLHVPGQYHFPKISQQHSLPSVCLLTFNFLSSTLESGFWGGEGRSFAFPSAAGPVPSPEEVLREIVE